MQSKRQSAKYDPKNLEIQHEKRILQNLTCKYKMENVNTKYNHQNPKCNLQNGMQSVMYNLPILIN